MIGQKEAVIAAVRNLLGPAWSPGSVDVRASLTDAQYRSLVTTVTQGIMAGNVKYSKSRGNYNDVFRYTQGMVANHMKKAVELNGGVKMSATGSTTIDMKVYPQDLQDAVAEYLRK